ncbi:MAG: 2-oxoacid:acceptor oxidoreductase subunit alpha [Candidatus Methanodesulfokora sp.]|jgi:2-oxoglutarate ferredoxin oxidoreductase subunit alpha
MSSKSERRLVVGYDALTDAAIMAGCRFFAGYPITPATEIAEEMARKLPKVGGIFIQMEDEMASLMAAIGASLAGLKAMTATSGPGFSLMQEAIGFAAITETPVVIADAQRVGPSTGMVTMPAQGDVIQARFGSHGDYSIIAIAPSSVQDIFEHTIMAFNYSELYRTPVILLLDEILVHLREPVLMPDKVEVVERMKPSVPPEEFIPYGGEIQREMPSVGDGYNLLIESVLHDELGRRIGTDSVKGSRMIKRLWNKIEENVEKIAREEFFMMDDADIAIVAYGSPFRSAIKAAKIARDKGIRAGVVKLVTLWPFHDSMIKKISEQVKAFIVPEMNMGKIAREVKRAAGDAKVINVPKLGGSLHTPEDILSAIKEVM